jgi:hypothetical protein
MDGVNASAVRKWVRRSKDLVWFRRVIDGAFASEFHRKKASSYLTLSSLLGDENKVERHLQTWEKSREKVLWPPIDRILLALRQRGLRWDGVFIGAQEEGRTWKHVAECPLCHDRLLVGVRDNGWASLRCSVGCEFFDVLKALGVDPDELARKFDPAEVPALESAQGDRCDVPDSPGAADGRRLSASPASSRASDLKAAA